jgi:uncharacterized membrane protein YphA (DoxX/SURF4 family)
MRVLGGVMRTSRASHLLALLGLCAAYVQGGFIKLMNFPGAVAEMAHFGLQPAALVAGAVIALDLGGSALVLLGFWRRWAALLLAAFTLLASFVANRFWETAGPEHLPSMNAFFEHLGLAGGWLLVALVDGSAPNVAKHSGQA